MVKAHAMTPLEESLMMCHVTQRTAEQARKRDEPYQYLGHVLELRKLARQELDDAQVWLDRNVNRHRRQLGLESDPKLDALDDREQLMVTIRAMTTAYTKTMQAVVAALKPVAAAVNRDVAKLRAQIEQAYPNG